MNDIGSKQINLINEVKKYFIKLNISELMVKEAGYIPSYGINPGNTKLLKWIDKELINIQNIKTIFKHLLAITSYHNYEIFNFKQKNYKNLFITWGKQKILKNKIFKDYLLNVDSI